MVQPAPGEDVNLGAIFRLAPGLLSPAGHGRPLDLLVDGRGTDQPTASSASTAHDGRVEISEHPEGEPDALVTGTQAEWVRALGPDGALAELDVRGDRALAEALLALHPARPRRRATQAA